MEAIRAENLTKNFGDVHALNQLSLSVERGEIFGLVGPDGAGKTTTMRLLTSVMDPTSGDAWVLGKHTMRESGAVKEDIGYMSQRFGLYPDLNRGEDAFFRRSFRCAAQRAGYPAARSALIQQSHSFQKALCKKLVRWNEAETRTRLHAYSYTEGFVSG